MKTLKHYSIDIPDLDIGLTSFAEVNFKSSLEVKEVVQQFGYYLYKEMNYDFVLFRAQEENEDNFDAYLIPSPTCLGFCCGVAFFRRRAGPVLNWVWIHPYDRRKGLLTKLWPTLKQKYGHIAVKGPFSLGMECFLEKQGAQFFLVDYELNALVK